MSGYQSMLEHFTAGSFASSKDISKKADLGKALSSLYVIPVFFRGVYYIPTGREREGHFIEKPLQFFSRLFDFVYGRKNWYWSLTTASRKYGLEWSSTKVLELVSMKESKAINIFQRAESLRRKKSYRSRLLSQFYLSFGINLLVIHKGKREFLENVKIDPDMGPVASRERLREDAAFFISKIKIKPLKRLYKKYLANLSGR